MRATFRILGPLEVLDGDRAVALGGLGQRALLALLLLRANTVVPTERLIAELWGESPPPTARQTVQVYVSQLRRAVPVDGGGDSAIETRAPGYLLHVAPGRLDLDRFQELSAAGRAALGAGDAAGAAATLREALALWRGPPLADFAYEEWAQREIARLEEARLACLEERIEADLRLGRHGDLVGELEALVEEHPLRERLRGQLMLALYRSGRQAEALERYASGRRALADELGIEPGGALRDLERRILTQDPALGPPPAADAPPPPAAVPARQRSRRATALGRPRALIALGAVVLAVAAGLGIWLAARGGDSATAAIPGDSVALIDPASGRAEAPIEVGGSPAEIALTPGAVWVGDVSGGALKRIDPEAGTVVQTIPLGGGPDGIAAGDGAVWATNGLASTLVRVSPETNAIVQTVRVPSGPRGVASGEGAVWVASRYARTVTRVDGASGRVAWTVPVGGSPIGIAVGAGAVWVTNETDASVSRIDPGSGRVLHRIGVGNSPGAIEAAGDAVWVANTLDGTVSRVDPATNAVAATVPVGDGPASIAAGDEGVWVANELGGTLTRIDPRTNAVVETIETGQRPVSLEPDGGRLWLAARDASAAHRGGTLRVAVDDIGPTIDQADYSLLGLVNLTGDGLTAYRRVSGTDGAALVPDLATSIPAPTDDGRTYTFQLRRGVRYSTGEVVRPEDIRRGIERFYRLGPAQPLYYDVIVGAEACRRKPASCDLSRGIVADAAANSVTIHLTRADPNLVHSLALPFAHAVAPSAPAEEVTREGLPATGPYMVASHRPGRELRLVRNPRFREWSRAARPDGYPDEILLTVADDRAAALTDVEAGRIDAALLGQSPPRQLQRLAVRHPRQVRTPPLPATLLVALNTSIPPFDRVDARRAVAYALDREELIRVAGGEGYGRPTCQVLPPNFPAYEPYCPYTRDPQDDGAWRGPDIEEARRLVASSGTEGAAVVVRSPPLMSRQARYVAETLRRLGYRATARLTSDEQWLQDAYGPDPDLVQAAVSGWIIDYPAPSTFFEQLRCGTPDPARFCDPAIDRRIDEALALQATDPAAADELWAGIDRDLTDQAPWVGYATPADVQFLAERVGNFQHHPVWRTLLDQLWVR
jgi:YVTN family beta-propeller protein